MKNNIKIFVILLLVLLSFNKLFAAECQNKEIVSYTDGKINLIAKNVQNKSKQEFLKYLNEEVSSDLAITYMSMWILGSNRNKFSDAQKERYTKVFQDYIVEFYGNILYKYRDKKFALAGYNCVSADLAEITYNIDLGDKKIPIVWRVKKFSDGKIRVTDFIVSGISFLKTKRDEFNSVLIEQNYNIDKFIDIIDKSSKSSN